MPHSQANRLSPPSPWIPAVHLLLDGLSKTTLGVGLLLGQLATVIERTTYRAALGEALPPQGQLQPGLRERLTIRSGSLRDVSV